MFSPYQWISPSSRTGVFWVFLAAALALVVVLQLLGAPLKTADAPGGIVSYELAGNAAGAQKILASWDTRVRAFAGLNLGLDYLFIVSYVAAIGLGCSLLAARVRQRAAWLAWAGTALAWAVILAGVLDALENVALLRLLLGGPAAGVSAWPAVARACAIPKFLISALGLLYLAAAGIVSLVPHAAPAATRSGARPAARKKSRARR